MFLRRCDHCRREFVLPVDIAFECACRQIQRSSGVGSELQKLIPKMFAAAGCNCAAYARKLDEWGVEKCEQNESRIVKRLVNRARRRVLLRHFPNFAASAAMQLVRTAIHRAKLKSPTVSSELLSAVWVYWPGGAEGDELKYSMRAAQANLSDVKNIVLCGGRPEWYCGDFIHSPRINKAETKRRFGSGRWAKWVDSINKLQRIIDSDFVTDRFLWMYDDTFIVSPTSIAALSVPRCGGTLPVGQGKKKNAWRECLLRTGNALQTAGRPLRNFSTHYPVVYEKSLLARTIDQFQAHVRPRAIESLYQNHHHDFAESIDPVFQYSKKIPSDWQVKPDAVVVNVGGFKPPVARIMQVRFPEPSSVEFQVPLVHIRLTPAPIEEPTSDRLVICVAGGDDYERQAAITAPAMRAYAERVNADFRLLSGDQFPAWAMANKYRACPYIAAYDRTLFLDADVVISPEAPDIFDVVPPESIAVFNEYPTVHWHGGSTDWVQREGNHICLSQEITPFRQTWMINAGVFILPRCHALLYAPPSKAVPTYWCAEQQWFTIRIAQSGAVPFHLDRRWNYSFVEQDFWQAAADAHFIHLNGSRPLSYRLELLSRMTARNFTRLDPPKDIGFLPNWLR